MSASEVAVFDEGRRRDPHNFDLHLTALSLRCQKWFGSDELMYATAQDVAAAAPPGSSAVLLPLFAHVEYAMREFSWGERTDKTLKRCRQYFARPEVQQELDGWVAKWRAGPANPARLGTCRQWVALYSTLAGRRQDAKAVFDDLGVHVTPTTAWAYFWGGEEYGYLKSWWWATGSECPLLRTPVIAGCGYPRAAALAGRNGHGPFRPAIDSVVLHDIVVAEIERLSERSHRFPLNCAHPASSGSSGRKLIRYFVPPAVHGVSWLAFCAAVITLSTSAPVTTTQPILMAGFR